MQYRPHCPGCGSPIAKASAPYEASAITPPRCYSCIAGSAEVANLPIVPLPDVLPDVDLPDVPRPTENGGKRYGVNFRNAVRDGQYYLTDDDRRGTLWCPDRIPWGLVRAALARGGPRTARPDRYREPSGPTGAREPLGERALLRAQAAIAALPFNLARAQGIETNEDKRRERATDDALRDADVLLAKLGL